MHAASPKLQPQFYLILDQVRQENNHQTEQAQEGTDNLPAYEVKNLYIVLRHWPTVPYACT